MTHHRSSVAAPILLVDDSLDDLYIVTRLLQKAGARNPIQVARDGEEAIYLLSKAKAHSETALPLAVFLDLAMPRRDGFGVLAWLNGIEELRSMYRIVLSVLDDPQDVQRAVSHGCHAFVRKYPTIAQCADLCAAADAFTRGTPATLTPGPHLLHPKGRAH